MGIDRRYFGTDGVRGRVGESPMTPDFVLKLGWATGCVLASSRNAHVLIGKDTRISGYMLESALEAGLSAAGANIRLLGPMPTPAIAYLTRTLRAAAGIVISASHNPYYDNGVKIFAADGTKISDALELQIEQQMDKSMETVKPDRLGKAERVLDAAGRYIEFCKSTVPAKTDLHGMRVVVDCAHGATYHIAPNVFEELGATVIRLGTNPNGININDGCGATCPTTLSAAVRQHNADVGIAIDGDGDRLIMADDQGGIVDGDELLYIIAQGRNASGLLQGGVVGTQMSNLGLEQALLALGVPFLRTQVGDRYVLERMQQEGWILGGETSGHIICLDRTSTGDAIVAALQVLFEMCSKQKSLREIKAGMLKYPQTLINVPVENGRGRAIAEAETIKAVVREVEHSLNGSGRVLLRPSGTEPLIRVMVEGPDEQTVRRCAEHIAARVTQESARAGA